MHLTEFDNQKLGVINIVNNYIEKNIDVDQDCLILRNPLQICQMLPREYKGSLIIINPKQTSNMKTKKEESLAF